MALTISQKIRKIDIENIKQVIVPTKDLVELVDTIEGLRAAAGRMANKLVKQEAKYDRLLRESLLLPKVKHIDEVVWKKN